MENFLSLDLPTSILNNLNKLGFNKPTPIQKEAIPLALKGLDIIGAAQTGTGKTGAFGIPLIVKLLNNPKDTALVVTPTRELATQVLQMLRNFIGSETSLNSVLLIGGESMYKQLQALKARPRLIVGTPGRINDHLLRNSNILRNTSFVVLDETDRMFDIGFAIQIEAIMKQVPEERQTLLFSATLPHNIIKLSKEYMKEPVSVSVDNANSTATNIKQEVMYVSEDQKYSQLKTQLDKRTGSIIIFVKTKMGTEKIAEQLCSDGHDADVIHGDLHQRQRERAIKAFRSRRYRIMVATDVAARGLDIPHIEHVINFDLPQSPEDYVHRIGRTARAGAEGNALCFITPADNRKWHAIKMLTDEEYKEKYKNKPQGKSFSGGKSSNRVFSSPKKSNFFGKARSRDRK